MIIDEQSLGDHVEVHPDGRIELVRLFGRDVWPKILAVPDGLQPGVTLIVPIMPKPKPRPWWRLW